MVELKPCQRVEACIADVMERFPTDSKDYYVEVHQHLAPLARRLERELDEAKAELARRATPPSPSTAPTGRRKILMPQGMIDVTPDSPSTAPTVEVDELPPIEYDKALDRTYIPLPGGWEIQTKGNGSTFRIAHIGSRTRWMVLSDELHEPLEALARDCRNALASKPPAREASTAYVPLHVLEALRAGCKVATTLTPGKDVDHTEAVQLLPNNN